MNMKCSSISKERRFAGVCFMPTCEGDRFEFVHRLPTTLHRRQAWLEALKEPSLERLQYPTICGRHFRPEDYVHADSRQLNRVALPTLNLSNLTQLNKCRKVQSYRINQNAVEVLECESRQYQESESQCEEHEFPAEFPHMNDVLVLNMQEAETADQEIMQDTDTAEDVKIDTVAEFDAENVPSKESTIKMCAQKLILRLSGYTGSLHLDYFWLRDFCRCENCYDPVTHMRINDASQLISEEQPNMVSFYHEQLSIEWDDGHVSRYHISDLIQSQTPGKMPLKASQRVPWMTKHATFNDDFNNITFNEIICNNASLNQALDRLQRSGLMVVSEVCNILEQKPFMTELLLRRLFPHNNQWIKEERNKFHNGSQRLPHTNCTFLSESCGLQILGLSPGSVTKMIELTIVDGLSVVQQLRETLGQTFDYLTQQKIPLVYRSSENFDYCTKLPMIQLHDDDGEVERIQFAPYHRGNMTKDGLFKYKKALRGITSIVEQKQMQWTLLLRNDELVILDNWRIL